MSMRIGSRLLAMAAMGAALLTALPGMTAVPATVATGSSALPRLIDAGMADVRPAGPRALAPAGGAVDQNDPEIIEVQDFENTAFPPTAWELRDVINGTTGASIGHGWSRQVCETPDGSQGAAWSVGGGTDGAGLACGAAYTRPVESYLLRSGIDTRSFQGGLLVTLNLWVDSPAPSPGEPEPFRVCLLPRGQTQARCFTFNLQPSQRRRWLELREPLSFPEAANREAVDILFVYRDLAPSGTLSGVFVDNVVIMGLPGAAPSTDTPETPPTGQATATRTPTRGPTATPTLRPTPTPAGRAAFLPILMQSADKDDPATFPTAPSTTINIAFGTDVRPDGTVVGASKVFAAGILRLCAKESWYGFARGTTIAWKWHFFSGGAWVEIPGAGDSADAGAVEWARQCITNEPGGNPAPLPETRYRVSVFVSDGAEPAAVEEALVTDDPGPGVPTLEPTFTPEPTIAPSATPAKTPIPGAPMCEPPIENGDFERGPSVGWFLRTNATDTNISRVIVRAADIGPNVRTAGGDWMAIMGGGVDVVDQLGTPLFELPDASDVVSATLDFKAAILTEQSADGTSDDTFAPFFISQDNASVQVPRSGISEENVPANLIGQWLELQDPIDVTQLIIRRDGWSEARLLFQSRNSADRPSVHFVDEVELVICLKGGVVRRITLASTAPGAGGRGSIDGASRARLIPDRSAPFSPHGLLATTSLAGLRRAPAADGSVPFPATVGDSGFALPRAASRVAGER